MAQPSLKTLERTVIRAGNFLRAAAQREVFLALKQAGFSAAEYQAGWKLYNSATVAPELPQEQPSPVDSVALAFKALDAWDDENFPILFKTLSRHDANFRDYLFDGGLKPEVGAASIKGIGLLLQRLEAARAETAPGREARRAQDKAALAVLASLGYHAEELARVRGLVETVTQGAPAADGEALPPVVPDEGEEASKELLDLYGWYEQWATIVRKRRVPSKHQRKLGLLSRGRPKGSGEKDEAPPWVLGDDDLSG